MVSLEGMPQTREADVKEWSKAACINLASEYRSRPELWDRSHSLYRVQTAKFNSWRAIAGNFSCEVMEVRKKMESILASYRRERAKVKDGASSTWFLYPMMDFLSGYVRSPEEDDATIDHILSESEAAARKIYASPYRAETNENDQQEQYQPDEELFQEYSYLESDATHVSDEEVIIKQEPISIEIIKEKPNRKHCKRRLTRTVKRKMYQSPQNTKQRRVRAESEYAHKTYVDEKFAEAKTLIDRGINNKNDCDSFGEYIAATLKKHDEKTQCLMKQAINEILFQQEMKKYDSD